jgi:hypothetical protein
MKKPTETALLRDCLELLRLRGVVAWRANAGGGLRRGRAGRMVPVVGNPAGTPDILAVLPPSGRLLGIEAKMPTGRTRPAQAAWAKVVRAAGGLYAIVRDVKELERLLEEEGIR